MWSFAEENHNLVYIFIILNRCVSIDVWIYIYIRIYMYVHVKVQRLIYTDIQYMCFYTHTLSHVHPHYHPDTHSDHSLREITLRISILAVILWQWSLYQSTVEGWTVLGMSYCSGLKVFKGRICLWDLSILLPIKPVKQKVIDSTHWSYRSVHAKTREEWRSWVCFRLQTTARKQRNTWNILKKYIM